MWAKVMEVRRSRLFSTGLAKMPCKTAWVLLNLKKQSRKRSLAPTLWRSIFANKLRRRVPDLLLLHQRRQAKTLLRALTNTLMKNLNQFQKAIANRFHRLRWQKKLPHQSHTMKREFPRLMSRKKINLRWQMSASTQWQMHQPILEHPRNGLCLAIWRMQKCSFKNKAIRLPSSNKKLRIKKKMLKSMKLTTKQPDVRHWAWEKQTIEWKSSSKITCIKLIFTKLKLKILSNRLTWLIRKLGRKKTNLGWWRQSTIERWNFKKRELWCDEAKMRREEFMS